MSLKHPVLNELEQELKLLMQSQQGRRSFLLALPILLASCSSSKHRNREGSNTGQETSLSIEDEKRMTAEVLPKMKEDYPPIPNQKLQNYIRNLGNKIVHKNGLHNRPYNYNFTVVDVGYVNAFALPAGTVFVTAPLITMAETEAELAGVVGHEIGHIKARHTAERIDQAEKSKKKSLFYSIGGGLLGGATGFALGRLMCPPKDKVCLAKSAGLGAAAGVGGVLLIQKYAFMANSREDEMEADRIGFRTSNGAGFHRNYIGKFYSKLYEMENSRKKGENPLLATFADALSTHPPGKERVAQMQQMEAEARVRKNSIISSKEFEQAQKIANLYGKKKA